jgi:hypothetical protein
MHAFFTVYNYSTLNDDEFITIPVTYLHKIQNINTIQLLAQGLPMAMHKSYHYEKFDFCIDRFNFPAQQQCFQRGDC